MSSKPTPNAQRPSIVLPAVILALVVIGGAVALKAFLTKPAPPPAVTETAPEPAQAPVRKIVPQEAAAQAPASTPAPAAAAPAPKAAPAPAAPTEPPANPAQLMVALTSLNTNGPISADDAQRWKASLQQLVRGGTASVSTIKDYLAQNVDVNFANVQGADQLGFSSLRAGLLDALGQIGGPESTAAMLQIMQTSVFPTDIASIATALQAQGPGQYQNDILSAVRAQLSLASQDALNGANVGPLFQVLATAAGSGADISADLAQYSSQWPYYTAIEMASLPNGAGVQSLAQMAETGAGATQSAAVQALAQLSSQDANAAKALVNMIQQGQLPDTVLAQLAPYLSGRQNQLGPANNPEGTTYQGLHISSGNQDYTVADQPMTPTQITQSISVLNQLLQSLPPDDTLAHTALTQQVNNLKGKLGK